jgi:hypothetical protein
MLFSESFKKYSSYLEQSHDLDLQSKLDQFKKSYEATNLEKNYFDYRYRSILHEIKTHEFLYKINNHLTTSNDKKSQKGPDYLQNNTWFECVIASIGEPNSKFYNESIDLFNREGVYSATLPRFDLMIRVTAAIKSKKEQYDRHLKDNIIEPNNPYVIVLDMSLIYEIYQPAYNDFKELLLPTLGIGNRYIKIDPKKSNIIESDYIRHDYIINKNGAKIDVNIFKRPEYSFISAILFTRAKCPPEAYDDKNSVFMLNPDAHNPFNTGAYPNLKGWREKDGVYDVIRFI